MKNLHDFWQFCDPQGKVLNTYDTFVGILVFFILSGIVILLVGLIYWLRNRKEWDYCGLIPDCGFFTVGGAVWLFCAVILLGPYLFLFVKNSLL